MKKPDWWPKCPYPESVFPMQLDDEERGYSALVPDGHDRAALSGALGREFWRIAEETIWLRYKEMKERVDWHARLIEEKLGIDNPAVHDYLGVLREMEEA